VIVCNPPYVATDRAPVAKNVRDFEPQVALFAGPEGLDVIRRVVKEAAALLRPGGHLFMEIGFDQAAAVRGLLAQAGWHAIVTYRDGAGHERVVQAGALPRPGSAAHAAAARRGARVRRSDVPTLFRDATAARDCAGPSVSAARRTPPAHHGCSILCEGEIVLHDVPSVADVASLGELLTKLAWMSSGGRMGRSS